MFAADIRHPFAAFGLLPTHSSLTGELTSLVLTALKPESDCAAGERAQPSPSKYLLAA